MDYVQDPVKFSTAVMVGFFSLLHIAFWYYHNSNKNKNENETESATSKGSPTISKPSLAVVSTLTNSRGSADLGLPSSMSQEIVDTIVATAPAVAPQALAITSNFYKRVLGAHPSLLAFFNPAHNVPISLHQPKALAASIVAYASNITDLSPLLVPGGAIDSICHRHCALAIFPESYVIVHDNLMKSIGEVLGSIVTADIAKAWSQAVLFLAKYMIDHEETLYTMAEQREGGWSGHIDFKVLNIETVGTNIKAFSFKPASGSPLHGKSFQFTTGQYLSLVVDIKGDGMTAPRHYTVTSPPGADFLQCTVKKHKGGVVSTHIHENLKVGDTVKLAAPFGVFTMEDKELDDDIEGAVLMSAGIGITPMLNFQRKLAASDKLKLMVHVDSKPESFGHRDFFRNSDTCGPEKMMERFTRVPGGKRLSAKELVGQVLAKVNDGSSIKHHFYICGPEKWMLDIQEELQGKKGVKKVMCEVFGSQLATGCPFFTNS